MHALFHCCSLHSSLVRRQTFHPLIPITNQPFLFTFLHTFAPNQSFHVVVSFFTAIRPYNTHHTRARINTYPHCQQRCEQHRRKHTPRYRFHGDRSSICKYQQAYEPGCGYHNDHRWDSWECASCANGKCLKCTRCLFRPIIVVVNIYSTLIGIELACVVSS